MKITGFNPLIVTKDAEPVITLFEELGFAKQHNLLLFYFSHSFLFCS